MPGPHVGGAFRGHLTAAEAGELARRAAARRLLLTHYSDELDAALVRAAGEAAFGGPVELAVEVPATSSERPAASTTRPAALGVVTLGRGVMLGSRFRHE